MLVLLPTWKPARRRTTVAALVVLALAVYVAIPGLLGRLRTLFAGISTDSSALSRTGSYDLAFEFIARAPLAGRGFGTFLPAYRILDNQYLGIIIELGVIGLIAVLAVLVSGMWTTRWVRRAADDAETRQLAQSLTAAIAVAGVCLALFDAFAFPMVSGLLFLLLGICGALRRLQLEPGPFKNQPAESISKAPQTGPSVARAAPASSPTE